MRGSDSNPADQTTTTGSKEQISWNEAEELITKDPEEITNLDNQTPSNGQSRRKTLGQIAGVAGTVLGGGCLTGNNEKEPEVYGPSSETTTEKKTTTKRSETQTTSQTEEQHNDYSDMPLSPLFKNNWKQLRERTEEYDTAQSPGALAHMMHDEVEKALDDGDSASEVVDMIGRHAITGFREDQTVAQAIALGQMMYSLSEQDIVDFPEHEFGDNLAVTNSKAIKGGASSPSIAVAYEDKEGNMNTGIFVVYEGPTDAWKEDPVEKGFFSKDNTTTVDLLSKPALQEYTRRVKEEGGLSDDFAEVWATHLSDAQLPAEMTGKTDKMIPDEESYARTSNAWANEPGKVPRMMNNLRRTFNGSVPNAGVFTVDEDYKSEIKSTGYEAMAEQAPYTFGSKER